MSEHRLPTGISAFRHMCNRGNDDADKTAYHHPLTDRAEDCFLSCPETHDFPSCSAVPVGRCGGKYSEAWSPMRGRDCATDPYHQPKKDSHRLAIVFGPPQHNYDGSASGKILAS